MRKFLIIVKLSMILAILAVIAITGGYFYFSKGLPTLTNLASYQPFLASRVYNFQGELLAEYADEHRILTPLSEMPEKLVQAFLAAEDEHFYTHPGINPPRILAAAIANLRAGHTVQGGSTITQQVAKNLLLTSERSYLRKIREAILAYRIEQNFSKDEILYLYMNHIYLGRGAYGVASAAWRYFNKRLGELSIGEMAMLAGLPKAPGNYAPHLNPERAMERRNTVIRMMRNSRFIDSEQSIQEMDTPLIIEPLPAPKLTDAYANTVKNMLEEQFGRETLRRQGLTIFIPMQAKNQAAAVHAVRTGILEIEQRQYYRGPTDTHPDTIWPDILEQWASTPPPDKPATSDAFPALVEEVLKNGDLRLNDGLIEWLLSKPKWRWKLPEGITRPLRWQAGDELLLQGDGKGGVRLSQPPSIESALYSIDLEKGVVLSSVGGYDFSVGEFDRSRMAQRQPGSAFKPFLYEQAMEIGFTPASTILDAPVVFENREVAEFWRPENYRNKFAGEVTLRDALEHSRNLATIKLLQDVGIDNFLRQLDRYQFQRSFPAELALALGGTEVTLEEMTNSYAIIASGGKRWNPVWVQQVQDRDGQSLFRSVAGHRCQVCHAEPVVSFSKNMQPYEQTLDETAAYLTTNLMKGVVNHGTGRRARALNRPTAGKTGTTNDQVDAWFIGYTPQILTGVWVGRDQPASMGRSETGAKAALPIWLSAMRAFHRGKPVKDFLPTDDIEWVVVDKETGKLADENTEDALLESFKIGTAPKVENDPVETKPGDALDFYDLSL